MNAIISGAGKGIGRAISQKLFELGYNLILISKSLENLEQTKSALLGKSPDQHSKISIFSKDLSKAEWMIEFAKKFSNETPDIIVNNVGTYYEDVASAVDLKELQRLFQLNFNSAVALTQLYLPEMRKVQKGHIFNICSVAAIEVKRDAISYSITKSALNIWGKSLREELKNDKIKLTNIFPGSVATPSWDGTDADPTKMIQVEDIANAIEYSLKLSNNANCDEIHLSPMGSS